MKQNKSKETAAQAEQKKSEQTDTAKKQAPKSMIYHQPMCDECGMVKRSCCCKSI